MEVLVRAVVGSSRSMSGLRLEEATRSRVEADVEAKLWLELGDTSDEKALLAAVPDVDGAS